MKHDYMELFDLENLPETPLSEAERSRVLQNALGKIQTDETVIPIERKRRRKPRLAVLIAAALVVLAVTAGAVNYLRLDGAFAAWYGDSAKPELLEALGTAGYPIGQSITQDGVTLTLEGVVGDAHSAMLLFTLQADEPLTVSEEYGFREANLILHGTPFGLVSWSLPDDDPTDGKYHFVYQLDTGKKAIGKELSLTLRDFVAYVPAEEADPDSEWHNEKRIAAGEWNFNFTLQHTDTSISVPVTQKLSYPGKTGTLQKITVSPLSVHLEYRRALLGGSSDTLRESPAVTLHFADGSTIGEEDQQTGGLSSDGLRLSVNRAFNRLIDLKTLTSLEIDGVEFPVG